MMSPISLQYIEILFYEVWLILIWLLCLFKCGYSSLAVNLVADTEEKEAILKREMAEAWRGWLSIIF
jgi:hypothetical protein